MGTQNKFVVGQSYRARLIVDNSLVESFAEFSGDRNPIHLQLEEAKAYGYPRQVAHGTILVALLSKMIGMQVPGPGAVWMSQTVEWIRPVFVDDEIELVITIDRESAGAGVLFLKVAAKNQEGKVVMEGEVKVKVGERLAGSNPSIGDTRRVALVTGGSRGIGAAIALRLAAAGMTVAVNYLESHHDAQHVVERIRSAGGSARLFAADLSDPAATSSMLQEIIESFSRVDVIVHGATPNIRSIPVSELSYAEIERYLRVYLGGALTLLAGARPGMTDRKFGRFVLLGTAVMFGRPTTGWAAYLVAKQALEGLVKCMAAELGPTGITTNMVSPGLTVSELTADIPARVKEVEARKCPMRRLATPADTAELVAFLASDAAGYINGANLPVTGGPV